MAVPAKKAMDAASAPSAKPAAPLSVVKNEAAPKAPARRAPRLSLVEGGKSAPQIDLNAWAMNALENSRANVFLCDLDFRIVFANQKAKDILEFMEPNLHKHDAAWKFFRASDIVGMNLDFLFTDEPMEFRRAADPRNHPYVKQIKTGPCVCDVQVTGIRDAKGELTGYAVDWERITDKLAQEKRIAQLMAALDGANTNVMMIDPDLKLIYMNTKSTQTLRGIEPDLKKAYGAGFETDQLMGRCIDEFHKNPAHQRRMLKDGGMFPHEANIQIGPLTLHLVVSQVKDNEGKTIAYSAEWEDVTDKLLEEARQQREVEEKAYLSAKIDAMMTATLAIAEGDLTQHIPVEKDDAIGKLAGAFNSMTASLSKMAQAADQIAEGNLTIQIEAQSPKDMLGNAFNKMVANLSEIVSQARTAADSIATASSEVATGTDDLAQRTEEQASSLEETAASMEEMTATVKQNADNARQANQLAGTARDIAEKGGVVVSTAVTSMEEINKASKRIADIISVIDEIAFQTNLLALNAAVEAARVGEQGRGFAVVAAEVRNLAGRSATAAKEIKALVQDSVQKVQEGSTLVNQSGVTLGEIVISVKKVADIIAEISAASQEQASGIDQVNKAIMQMDQITQQNAALVEETAAASRAMTDQATTLQNVVGQFQLDDMYLEEPPAPVKSSRPKPAAPAKARPQAASAPGRFQAARPAPARRPAPVAASYDNDDFEEF